MTCICLIKSISSFSFLTYQSSDSWPRCYSRKQNIEIQFCSCKIAYDNIISVKTLYLSTRETWTTARFQVGSVRAGAACLAQVPQNRWCSVTTVALQGSPARTDSSPASVPGTTDSSITGVRREAVCRTQHACSDDIQSINWPTLLPDHVFFRYNNRLKVGSKLLEHLAVRGVR